MQEEKPFDRVKVKFKDGRYHIQEIEPVYDLELIKESVPFYLELAKEILGIDDNVDVEYARTFQKGDEDDVAV